MATNKKEVRKGNPYTDEVARKIAIKSGFMPSEPYKNANTAWKGNCMSCGKKVQTYLKHLKNGGNGCISCANDARLEKLRRATEIDALKLLSKMKFQALEPFQTKKQPWKMRHKVCGETVSPSLNKIETAFKNNRDGCDKCSGKIVDPIKADAVMESAGLTPLVKFTKANAKWKSRCNSCGKVVSPSYSTVKIGHKGCAYCAGVLIHPTDARKLMSAYGYKPKGPYPGSEKPWESVHLNCGRTVKPSLGKLKSGSGGCIYCRTGGFDSGSPAILYLITHNKLNAAKIGISKDSDYRLIQHENLGWRIFKTYKGRGDIVLQLENKVLEFWRIELGLKAHLKKSDLPQGGYTETVALSEISLTKTWNMVLKVEKELKSIDLPVLEPRNFKKEKVKVDWKLERAEAALKFVLAKGFNPEIPYPGINKPWLMSCNTCGTVWEPIFYNVRKGSGCPHCGRLKASQNNKTNKGKIATEKLIRLGWEPRFPYPGVTEKWSIKCSDCGHKKIITAHEIIKLKVHCQS